RLYPSRYQVDSGLSPVRNVRRQAHNKKAGASAYANAPVVHQTLNKLPVYPAAWVIHDLLDF
ncbi:hypothetical protein, partial [Enterocloster clostridioformis]|uniref:hypothetical protein n=1 Tax=Enterocloster clostridioformis TaxID=1531 RepID=UPI003D31E09A